MRIHRYGTAGPVVVLIHGIPGSARVWTEVTAQLGRRHSVLVPELLGFGDESTDGGLEATVQARALATALDRERVGRATIVGHDFGGPIAMSLFASRPDLFEAFALLATNAFPDTPIPFPLSTVNWPLVGNGMARIVFSAPALKMMLWRYGSKELGNPVSVRKIFTDALQNLPERYGHFPAILRQVDVPALVLWGERDPFFSVAQGQRLADLLVDPDFEVLDGAGHFLPEQRPDEVAGCLEKLIARALDGPRQTERLRDAQHIT